ncbi:hypothetical protein D3C78_1599650 [compost metagenome]
MPGVDIVNTFHTGIYHKINGRKVVLDQPFLNIELIKPSIELLNYLFRLYIRSYRVL